MALVRCVTEMGMGVDVYGLHYTSAAKRAVFDFRGYPNFHNKKVGIAEF